MKEKYGSKHFYVMIHSWRQKWKNYKLGTYSVQIPKTVQNITESQPVHRFNFKEDKRLLPKKKKKEDKRFSSL